jgi:ABC-type transporter Mla subunit MlaD
MNHNSLFKDFNPTPTGDLTNFLNRFNQFSSQFSGNPETRVKQLLQSGQMSQEQFNQFAQTANMLRKLIK